MGVEAYKDGMSYEIFIKRAYPTFSEKRQISAGGHLCYMRNLIDSEQGNSCVTHLGSTTKLLNEVKTYMDKAFDRFIAMNKDPQTDHDLRELKELTSQCQCSEDLMRIVNVGLKITDRFK